MSFSSMLMTSATPCAGYTALSPTLNFTSVRACMISPSTRQTLRSAPLHPPRALGRLRAEYQPLTGGFYSVPLVAVTTRERVIAARVSLAYFTGQNAPGGRTLVGVVPLVKRLCSLLGRCASFSG